MNKNQYIKIFSVSAILLATACSPKVENRGYVKQDNWKDAITIGKTNKQEIVEKFGSPSTMSNFGAETWYYISSRKETIGFMKPELVKQEAVNITFDTAGIVSSLGIYNKDNAKEFDLVKRTTPTEGHSLSFIDQTLGNIGRFNKSGSSNRRSPGGNRGGF